MMAMAELQPGGVASKRKRPYLLPYQIAWCNDTSPVKVCVKGRKTGMTYAEAANIAMSRLNGTRPIDVRYSSADEDKAREFVEEVKFFCEAVGQVVRIAEGWELFEARDMRVFTIDFPEVRGRTPRLTAMSSNPKAFRGPKGDVVLDELAFHERPAEIWKAAVPVTTWGGRIAAISTHNGMLSRFNTLCEMGHRRLAPEAHGSPLKTDLPVSLHHIPISLAVEQGLVERINEVMGTSYTRESFLADCRSKCMSEPEYLEEYECVPRDAEMGWFPFSVLEPVTDPKTPLPKGNLMAVIADVVKAVEETDGEMTHLYAGADIGRSAEGDKFVLWILGRRGSTFTTIGVLRWRGRQFAEMRHAIDAVMGLRVESKKGNTARVRCIAIDKTGLGMQLAEECAERYRSRCEPVAFTVRSKADMATRCRKHMEDRTVTIPNDEEINAAFGSIDRLVSSSGAERFVSVGDQSGHADEAWACMLGLHAAAAKKSAARVVALAPGVM